MRVLASPGPNISEAKVANFMPIILVPRSPESIVQLHNVAAWLESGLYESGSEQWVTAANPLGESNRRGRPAVDATATASGVAPTASSSLLYLSGGTVRVSPGKMLPSRSSFPVKFNHFRVLDDPAAVDNWDHVCACFVLGKEWQFDGWFNGQADKTRIGTLFSNVRGFFPYFEEERVPDELRKWNVVGLQLSYRRTKGFTAVKAAAMFWEELYKFLSTNKAFRCYTKAPPTTTLAE